MKKYLILLSFILLGVVYSPHSDAATFPYTISDFSVGSSTYSISVNTSTWTLPVGFPSTVLWSLNYSAGEYPGMTNGYGLTQAGTNQYNIYDGNGVHDIGASAMGTYLLANGFVENHVYTAGLYDTGESIPQGTPFYWQIDSSGDFVFLANNTPPSPPAPSATWIFPVQSTSTNEFTNWNLSIANVTTTDEYRLDVFYSPFGSSITYDDYNLFYPTVSSAQLVTANKSIALSSYSTSTSWEAYASLTDLTAGNQIVATSSAITFSVNSATTTYTGFYNPTYTAPSSTEIFQTTSTNQFATTTCNWGDFGCNLGNVANSVLNFIFGINPTEIQTIAGFNLASQAPFNTIPEIQNDFSNLSLTTPAMVTSTLTINLGGGNIPAVWLSPSEAQTLLGPAGPMLRSLALSFLYLIMIYGFYLEIKAIFRPHQK